MTGPQEPEPDLGEVEWLDDGPADPAHQPRIPRGAWYALIAVVIAAVVVALTVSRRQPKHQAAVRPTPTPTTPSPRPTPSRTTFPDPPSTGPSVTVRSLGHPVLDVPRGVELFARGGDTLLRIELATGRITRTTGVELSGGGPISFVVTRHAAIESGWDSQSGVLIPDGRPPRALTGHFEHNSTVLPGPDPDHVWVSSNDAANPHSDLVDLAGRRTGVVLPVSGGEPDGTGYLLTYLTGGVYDARPGSLQRVTTGALLAVGPTRWLTQECDDHHRCTLDVVDRATGEHRSLRPMPDDSTDSPGMIAPDGTVAAIAQSDAEHTTTTLQLVDLTTGAERRIPVELGQNQDGQRALAWTPDSRWLLTIDSLGRIVAVDRAGHTRTLTRPDTPITQLALRAP